MLEENGERSRAHGLPLTLLQQQAEALSIPLIVRSTSWDDYEATFISTLREFKEDGVGLGVFGDLGRILNADVIKDIDNAGIDASGETGEYHTVVTDGPLFSFAIHIAAGDFILRDGYWFLDVSISAAET